MLQAAREGAPYNVPSSLLTHPIKVSVLCNVSTRGRQEVAHSPDQYQQLLGNFHGSVPFHGLHVGETELKWPVKQSVYCAL